MGVGNVVSDVFGGENDYNYEQSPFVNPEDIEKQRMAYSSAIQNAITRPQLDFNRANTFGNQTSGIGNQILSQSGKPIDFSKAEATQGLQSGLINDVLATSRGQGPNPALMQLRQTTDENNKKAAGFAASQRGVNPAMAARIAAQMQAQNNQGAAGQAATLAAQQQLGAQGQAGQLLSGQSAQQAAQAQALAQQRLQQQQAAAGIFGNQQQMLGQQAINESQAKQNLEGMRRQAELAYQKQIMDAYNSQNAINAGVSSQNAATNFQYGSGVMTGLSSAFGGGMFEGGKVPENAFALEIAKKAKGYAMGGDVQPMQFGFDTQLANGPSPMNFYESEKASAMSDIDLAGQQMNKKMAESGLGAKAKKYMLGGGNPMEGAAPGMIGDGASPLMTLAMASSGGKIDGKAKVDGDHPVNDTVPAMLSPGEIVIPKSKVQDPEQAHAFLDHILKTNQKAVTFDDLMKSKKKMEHYSNLYNQMYCGGKV